MITAIVSDYVLTYQMVGQKGLGIGDWGICGQNYQAKTGHSNTNTFGNVTNNNYYGNPPQP
ncbi:hypothetical protein H6G93_10135 [Nostoc sp. FACHB-973]|uniref:Uncharacterized protein n=1 Tax=Desmonostoc muscorum LEGE 12446 TaxID=1828758 RepID=A0A8J7DER0_DESMC|nr:hypothetical protein [Desmonostoc muscorum]MBD2515362.1 hypothetical protein [Nostoc sp. FACHB-973]MCF2151083.1 hypothetical protein [Desmonostoc muscorum LEGE 12446]